MDHPENVANDLAALSGLVANPICLATLVGAGSLVADSNVWMPSVWLRKLWHMEVNLKSIADSVLCFPWLPCAALPREFVSHYTQQAALDLSVHTATFHNLKLFLRLT